MGVRVARSTDRVLVVACPRVVRDGVCVVDRYPHARPPAPSSAATPSSALATVAMPRRNLFTGHPVAAPPPGLAKDPAPLFLEPG